MFTGSGDGTVGEDEIDSNYGVECEAPHARCEAKTAESYGQFQKLAPNRIDRSTGMTTNSYIGTLYAVW